MTALRAIVSLTLLAILVWLADIERIIQLMTGFSPVWLIVTMLLIATSVWLSAWKWGVLLRALGHHLSLGKCFNFYVVGLFYNNFLPSSIGGDGIRIYLAGKETGSHADAASSVVWERLLATFSLAFLGLLGTVFATFPLPVAIVMLLVLLLVAIVMLLIVTSGWLPAFVRNGTRKWHSGLRSFAESAVSLRRHWSALIRCSLLTVAFQINVALVTMAVMAGLSFPLLGFFDLLYITCASSVLAVIPLGVNGYGLREGAYIVLLTPYGYSVAEAMTISILFAVFVSLFSLWGAVARWSR